MIKSKDDLHEYLKCDGRYYENAYANKAEKIRLRLKRDVDTTYIRRYLIYLRKSEYCANVRMNRILRFIRLNHYERKRNRLGAMLGISIPLNTCGKGLVIYHHGCIVINPSARLGDGCRLHGANCIGNKGNGTNGDKASTPVIGNGVDIGFGASVIGNVTLADDIVIGAGAVVTKSCDKVGAVLCGVPAEAIR